MVAAISPRRRGRERLRDARDAAGQQGRPAGDGQQAVRSPSSMLDYVALYGTRNWRPEDAGDHRRQSWRLRTPWPRPRSSSGHRARSFAQFAMDFRDYFLN